MNPTVCNFRQLFVLRALVRLVQPLKDRICVGLEAELRAQGLLRSAAVGQRGRLSLRDVYGIAPKGIALYNIISAAKMPFLLRATIIGIQ